VTLSPSAISAFVCFVQPELPTITNYISLLFRLKQNSLYGMVTRYPAMQCIVDGFVKII
jgi:hypothetical protein